MITLEKAKEALGYSSKEMSDTQVIHVVETLTKLVNLVIDNYMAMTLDQRKKIADKYAED